MTANGEKLVAGFDVKNPKPTDCVMASVCTEADYPMANAETGLPVLPAWAQRGWTWAPEVALQLVPVGMVAVLNGTIDDGYGGMLGWFWLACAVTTIVLVVVTRKALQERYYSAVMAATGLLYLAILTAFGTDLVARAVLASA